jgi:hypothetical protein
MREPNPSSRTMALGSTQPITKMSTKNLPGGKGRPAFKTDKLTAICEPTVKRPYGSLDVLQPYGLALHFYIEHVMTASLQILSGSHAGSSHADFSTLKMELTRSSETSVHITSTRRQIPEDGVLLEFPGSNLS